MTFFEHISEIDNLLLERKNLEYKKNLFNVQCSSVTGMNFTHINTMPNGNMTNISVLSNGTASRYTVFKEPTGMTVYGPGF